MLPKGTRPSELSEDFTRRESLLVQACQTESGRLTTDGAKQHLVHGFQRRVLLNQTSRFRISAISSSERKEVLDPSLCCELSVHLNSFFLQLRGGLDNLAWALHYEFEVLGQKDETDARTRSKCGLFDTRFLIQLALVKPSLAALIRDNEAWAAGFKELRDPAAHRVPLFALPGIIREGSAEATRHAALQVEIRDAINAGDLDLLTDRMFQSFRVGTYEPVFAQYAPSEMVLRDIHSQVAYDHDHFLTVSEAVLESLFN